MATKTVSLYVFRSHVGKQVSGPTSVIKFVTEFYQTESEDEAVVLRRIQDVKELGAKEIEDFLKGKLSSVSSKEAKTQGDNLSNEEVTQEKVDVEEQLKDEEESDVDDEPELKPEKKGSKK